MNEAIHFQPAPPPPDRFRLPRTTACVALVGHPNTGKTTLFNALTGIRAKTSNFPGTTVELRRGRLRDVHQPVTLIDLPGMYSLQASTPDEAVAKNVLFGPPVPDAILAVINATDLERHLLFASQLMELDRPVIIALTMMDVADRKGIHIDLDALRAELRCPVVPVSARSHEGLQDLRDALMEVLTPERAYTRPVCDLCPGCPLSVRHQWSRSLCTRCVRAPDESGEQHTERIDHWLTHPVAGLMAFLTVMLSVFLLIFHVAEWPMAWIEFAFETATDWAGQHAGDSWFADLLTQGVLAGVGAVMVFLPQICLLFFVLSLLEDTGYLARAAVVMERWMKRIGLPGKAFVPLLSAHACAIPAIMATRVLEQPRDRLLTILVAPLLSCSARLPVYIMIAGLLVPGRPGRAALLLTGAYLAGIGAALGAAYVLRRTLLPGKHQPLIIELPDYRLPGLRPALWHTWDRALIFLKQAGTLILLFSVIMWFLTSFPAAPSSEIEAEAQALEHTYAGHIGHLIEPVIRPLGFDWQIGIGLLSSFAAREVLVSTLAIIYGQEQQADDPERLTGTLRQATRADGSPVFTAATCMSLLVFFILAAQCIPTQIVTKRETGSWKWAALQFTYMNTLAYLTALITYQSLRLAGL